MQPTNDWAINIRETAVAWDNDSSDATWTSDQIGEAMAACAHQLGQNVKHGSNGVLDFNAWWRDGDGPKVRVWIDRGAWWDIKEDIGGGGVAFAEIALGCSLPEMMQQYNPKNRSRSAPKTNTRAYQRRNEIADPEAPRDDWRAILRELEPAPYALKNRGVPLAKCYILRRDHFRLFDEARQEFLGHHMGMRDEHLIAVPFCTPTGVITGMHIRGKDGRRVKKHITGSQFRGMGPVGYNGCVRMDQDLLITEGMLDCLAMQPFFNNVFGCCSAHQLEKITDWLLANSFSRRIYIAYHLDQGHDVKGKGKGQSVARAALEKLTAGGKWVQLIDWPDMITRLRGDTSTVWPFDQSGLDLGDCIEKWGWGRTVRALAQTFPDFGTVLNENHEDQTENELP